MRGSPRQSRTRSPCLRDDGRIREAQQDKISTIRESCESSPGIARTFGSIGVHAWNITHAKCSNDNYRISVLAGTYGIADDGTAVQKAIFLRIRKAAEAPTFEGAGVILGSIKTQDITDPDLASLFAITKEFTEFCSDVGIPRDAKVSYIEILARIDRAAILSKLIERGGENAPAEAARLIAKGRVELKDQIPLYEQLDRKLAERYGLAPPPRKVDLTVAACAGQHTCAYGWKDYRF